ncbi:MAG TPA: 50S ribosomal protein L10, partial [Rhodospirillaceae bacterium]|nr:50S ribosomal protein L10 [Rhodospirillaceae bacterium]
MDRARKEELVTELNQSFAEAALVVVTQQTGLTVTESTDLRGRMR